MDKMKTFYEKPSSFSEDLVLRTERNLTERTAWILQAYKSFVAMSKNEFRAGDDRHAVIDAPVWGSLEDIHNTLHRLIGMGGHMNSLAVSAFDPLFWLRK